MIKHNKHICEQSSPTICLPFWSLQKEFLIFLLWNTVPCAAPLFLASKQREFNLWYNLFPLQTLSSSAYVYLCNYLWIKHAQILQSSLITSFCKHNSESTHINAQIKSAINKPEVSNSNKVQEQQKNGNGGIISSSHFNISPRGYAIFTSFAVIYLFWLKPTSILRASPWQSGWHPALSSHTQHLTGQTTCNNLSIRSESGVVTAQRPCHSTHTMMFPVFSVAWPCLDLGNQTWLQEHSSI